jgi:F420-dependent methylenetetrahydromethanopterin dehydrogenase
MGYNARRELHMAKLAMIFSLSRSDELLVTEQDVAEAIQTLLLFESKMNNIFQEMAATGSMVMLQDVIDKIKADTAEGRVTEEASIINMLMQRFPSTQVHSMIDNLINAKAIKMVGGIDVKGCRKFQAGEQVALV